MHPIDNIIILDKESPIFANINKNHKFSIVIDTDIAAYILACSKALTAISSCLEKTKLSISFLDINHLEAITSEDISKGEHIELLVENTIIRVQSIYDRALIFTNRLLDLGISNDSINHNLLVTNEKVKAYGLDIKLKAINKACSNYKIIRNTVIHHDRYSEEELDQVSLIMKADHLSRKNSGAPFVDTETLNQIVNDYLKFKRDDLKEYLKTIEDRVHELYDAAIPIYTHYKNKLRTISTQ